MIYASQYRLQGTRARKSIAIMGLQALVYRLPDNFRHHEQTGIGSDAITVFGCKHCQAGWRIMDQLLEIAVSISDENHDNISNCGLP